MAFNFYNTNNCNKYFEKFEKTKLGYIHWTESPRWCIEVHGGQLNPFIIHIFIRKWKQMKRCEIRKSDKWDK
jgi:hypothetical protein